MPLQTVLLSRLLGLYTLIVTLWLLGPTSTRPCRQSRRSSATMATTCSWR